MTGNQEWHAFQGKVALLPSSSPTSFPISFLCPVVTQGNKKRKRRLDTGKKPKGGSFKSAIGLLPASVSHPIIQTCNSFLIKMIYRVIEFQSLKELERLALSSHLKNIETEAQGNRVSGRCLGVGIGSGDSRWLILSLGLCQFSALWCQPSNAFQNINSSSHSVWMFCCVLRIPLG